MVWKLKLFLLFILQHFTLESEKQLAFETTKVDANDKKWRREESQRGRDSRKMRGPFPPGPHYSSPGQLGSMAIPRFTLSYLSKQNKETGEKHGKTYPSYQTTRIDSFPRTAPPSTVHVARSLQSMTRAH